MRTRRKILTVTAAVATACAFAAAPVNHDAQAESAGTEYTLSAPNAERAQVRIIAGGKTFTYTDELIQPSDFTVAETIELRRINATAAEKMELVDSYIQKGADYKTALSVCFPRLSRTVDAASAHVYRAPVDAQVVYKNGVFSVADEREGIALDEYKLYGGIYYCLKFLGGGQTVKAHTVAVPPRVTKKELAANLVLRGEYTTEYRSSTAARAHNVAFAAKKIDGKSIAPGETLSFNSVVGERTAENGFKTAKIIVNGQYVDGIGGGACQASTAVYNAALLAGLECRANSHTICPSYCPPGLDAMISTSSDLFITNTTPYPVYFSVAAADKKVSVRVFGAPTEYKIVPETVVLKTYPHEVTEAVDTERKYFDDGAASGDRLLLSPGKDGYESATYLKYYDEGGNFVKRVKIRGNIYKPVPQIVAIAP